jgi:signal peptidase II
MTSNESEASKEAPQPTPAAPQRPPAGGNAHLGEGLSIVLGFLAADHLTKWLAIRQLKPEWWDLNSITQAMLDARPVVTIIPNFLRFVYAENRGAAFSILYGHTFFLGIVSALATALLIWFWRSLPAEERLGRIAVALILSGAIGNMIDRFARGYVVDFIDAHWMFQAHWPTFNIADSCICIGAVLLGVLMVRGRI